MKKILLTLAAFSAVLSADYFVISSENGQVVSNDFKESLQCVSVTKENILDTSFDDAKKISNIKICDNYTIVTYQGDFVKVDKVKEYKKKINSFFNSSEDKK